jgi:hypothetical protein
MTKIKLTADLDRLIKRAAEVKTAALKGAEDVSSKIDKKEDGTSAATTGSHAADNKASAGEITAAAVDGGAKDNKANGSVTNNTDGSAAAATDGQKGPAAGEFPVKSEADNGPTKGEGKFAEVRKLASDLRAAADAMLTNLDKFLVKSARASDDKQVKTAADGMGDDDLAGQASDALMEQIAAGKVSDEDATQILQEAVASGALTPEELQQAAQMADQAQQQGGDAGAAPADAGAPPVDAGAPPADAGAPPVAAPDDEAAAQLPPEAQAKMAAAAITPEHPKYLEKLAAINDEDMKAGYTFFNKLAEVIVKEAKEVPAKAVDEKKEKAHEAKETPKEEKKEEAAKVVDAMSGVNLAPADEAEKQALAAVKQELGIDDKQLAEIASTPVPANQDKVAAAKSMYRSAIMAKVASLQK